MSAYCIPGTGLDQRIGKLWPWTTPSLLPIFINHVLLGNTTYLCVYVLPVTAFMLQWQELNDCNKLHKAKNTYYPTLYRKSLPTFQLNTRDTGRLLPSLIL